MNARRSSGEAGEQAVEDEVGGGEVELPAVEHDSEHEDDHQIEVQGDEPAAEDSVVVDSVVAVEAGSKRQRRHRMAEV